MPSAENIELHFTEDLHDIIWKTLADPVGKKLYIETRNKENKTVSFSMFDLQKKKWAWRNVTFDEPWWISLGAVSGNVLLFTLYTDKDNPDKKSILAFDVAEQKMMWWKHHFVLAFVSEKTLTGVETKFGSKEMLLDLQTGEIIPSHTAVLEPPQNFMIIRPFQYHEGTDHFETVRAFIEKKCDFSPVLSVEYCEHHSLIFISAFAGTTDLANYLIVFNSEGELVLKETLGDRLKGIASDTFFILQGFLIFVKNKSELVSYRIV